MDITILSRAEMISTARADLKLLDKVKVISVHGQEATPVFPYVDHPNLLTLMFDDVTEEWSKERYVLFNKDLAKQVLDFVAKLQPTDSVIVHCYAGVSRSGAIGTFIAEQFGGSEYELARKNPRISPNPFVLKVLDEVHAERTGTRAKPREESILRMFA